MAGYFSIIPDGESTMVISTVDNPTDSVYTLVYADFNEKERETVLYSGGRINGRVTGIEAPLSNIWLTILVGGDTPEEIASNALVLQNAFGKMPGGYLLYRPPGYADNIIATWYSYLKSPPPQIVNPINLYQAPPTITPGAQEAGGGLYKFTIKIRALATSSPLALATIVSETLVRNFITPTALSDDPYLIIPTSAIKGDGFIPSFEITGDGTANVTDIIVHLYDAESGDEGEEFYDGDDPNYTLVYYSDTTVSFNETQRFYTASASAIWGIMFGVQSSSRRLLNRRCIPIFSYVSDSGDGEWEYRIHGRAHSDMGVEFLTSWRDLPNAAVPAGFWNIGIAETVTMPTPKFPYSEPLSKMSCWIGMQVREKTSTPGQVQVYGLLLLPSDGDSWIARFTSRVPATDKIETNEGLEVDGANALFYRFTYPDGPTHAWEKRGMPVESLVMPKGNYELRTLCYGVGTGALGWYHNNTYVNIIVKGLFYTIYPFSEV